MLVAMLMFPEMFRGRNVLLFTASLTVLRCLMHGYMRTLELAHLPGCARARPAPRIRTRSTSCWHKHSQGTAVFPFAEFCARSDSLSRRSPKIGHTQTRGRMIALMRR